MMNARDARDPWTSLVLLERLRNGDEPAAEMLFARYFERLTALARSRLSARLAQRADPEDIALSAYRSFFVRASEGRFVLGRGGDLWRLLSSITIHKLLRTLRHERAARRSFEVEAPLDRAAEAEGSGRSPEPTPEEAVALADELEWIFSQLDALGRRVLELRLQGLRISEIAQDVGRSERSVRRALAQVRDLMTGRIHDD